MNTPRICTEGLTSGYDATVVTESLSIDIPAHGFTVIVGPNACGKSTLLRTIARIQRPLSGRVLLDGADIHRMRSKDLARNLGMLPQTTTAPDKLLVRDLVARGRSPHQSLFRQWSAADAAAVDKAMELTRITGLANRDIDSLSGGQRQRVWLALVLAQQTETVLLDEPTTFLDLAHQMDMLELCRRLHTFEGRTIVAVLHDLNQAARYATHLIAMRDGNVVAHGAPAQVITESNVYQIFGVRSRVITDPVTGSPMVVPLVPERDDPD